MLSGSSPREVGCANFMFADARGDITSVWTASPDPGGRAAITCGSFLNHRISPIDSSLLEKHR
jgi:hypothetical protein